MDAILILGAAVWADGPSPALRRRTNHAAKLFHDGCAPLIIPCGGMGRHAPAEAVMMQSLLVDAGIPPQVIKLEDRSTNTLENILFAKELVPGRRVTIVTDQYHGPRALMVARHLGLSATLSCPAAPALQLRQILREVFARRAYMLKLRRISPED